MELIQHILKYTTIWDTLRIRRTCKQLQEYASKDFAKKKWARDKEIVETKLLKNKVEIMWAIILARLKLNMSTQRVELHGDKRRLLTKLKENEKLEEEAWRMRAEFQQHRLPRFGMKKALMQEVKGIRGDNLWSIDVEGSQEGILIIPRELGMDGWCGHHHKLSSCLVVELVLHNWESGVDHTVSNIDETDPLRSIRMVPIFGRRHQLVSLLQDIGLYTTLRQSERDEQGGLWIPNRMCRVDGERM